MAAKVRFYDLSGDNNKPWSPPCWTIRYVLNFKGIPYETVKVSFPGIKDKCEELLDMSAADMDHTVPIVEILGPEYKALNDSTPIFKLLSERFTEKDGYKHVTGVDDIPQYETETKFLGRSIQRWILHDIYLNALKKDDGSREFFKQTREDFLKCEMRDVIEIRGGGEAKVLEDLKQSWLSLKQRMSREDGTGEPTYIDFRDAGMVKWIQGSSAEKFLVLMDLYGDDTFTKLLKKVEPYTYGIETDEATAYRP